MLQINGRMRRGPPDPDTSLDRVTPGPSFLKQRSAAAAYQQKSLCRNHPPFPHITFHADDRCLSGNRCKKSHRGLFRESVPESFTRETRSSRFDFSVVEQPDIRVHVAVVLQPRMQAASTRRNHPPLSVDWSVAGWRKSESQLLGKEGRGHRCGRGTRCIAPKRMATPSRAHRESNRGRGERCFTLCRRTRHLPIQPRCRRAHSSPACEGFPCTSFRGVGSLRLSSAVSIRQECIHHRECWPRAAALLQRLQPWPWDCSRGGAS